MYQTIHGLKIHLQVPHDFSWLRQYDDVFAIFDQQDSGNISFGVHKNGRKLFVKYAGARNLLYYGSTIQAILNLQQAVFTYKELAHPNLVKVLTCFSTSAGMAVEFEWLNGVNLYPHWTFEEFNRYFDPASPYYQSRHLPLAEKLAIIRLALDFLVFTEAKQYTAVDFYDGSLMYDFQQKCLKIIDIDLFQKGPVYNTIGQEFWGAKRIKSPEECIQGCLIDQTSNVYSAAKLIMELLAVHEYPQLDELGLPAQACQVLTKATQLIQKRRYQSVAEFQQAWLACFLPQSKISLGTF